MKRSMGLSALFGGIALLSSAASNATLIYDAWTSNDATSGNYIITVNHNQAAQRFDINFTVNPWNAEGLGLFIDLGDFDLSGPLGLTGVSPSGQVALFRSDTTSNSCGQGCNLNGLSLPALGGDGEWELVFRLGAQGFDGIQTFEFSFNDFGLTESAFGLVGVRAQQLCDAGNTLPNGNCGGSDKSYGYPGTPEDPDEHLVPLPGTLVLIALGLIGLGWSRKGGGR